MSQLTPTPLRPLGWLLRQVSSQADRDAVVGDVLEELTDLRARGRWPRHPAVWVNLQVLRAVQLEVLAALPRLLRSAGLIQRDAVRAMRAAPAHSVFVMLVLAAGISVGTLTFSVVDAVVLKPLPIDRPEQLVSIPTRDESFKVRITPEIYWGMREQLGSVEVLAARLNSVGDIATVAGVKSQMTIAHAVPTFSKCCGCRPVSAVCGRPTPRREAIPTSRYSATGSGGSNSAATPRCSART